jgi:hypothetical protein
MFSPTPHPPARMQDHAWFAVLLVAYAFVELSFNHRMLELTEVLLSADDLDGLEFWGRTIAGFGLSMQLLRWLDLRMANRWKAVLVSFALGMTLMWQFQKMVIQYLVDSAPESEKIASLYSQYAAELGAQGQLRVKGAAVGTADMAQHVRQPVRALFPAAALGTPFSDFEASASDWSGQAPPLAIAATPAVMDKAYRNTVTPPIALGFSSFFGLLNLAQGLGLGVILTLNRRGYSRWASRLRKHLLALTVALILGLSASHHNSFIDSEGYASHLSPKMWQHNAVLASFVGWGLRAEPGWYDLFEAVHHHLLRDFSFPKQ